MRTSKNQNICYEHSDNEEGNHKSEYLVGKEKKCKLPESEGVEKTDVAPDSTEGSCCNPYLAPVLRERLACGFLPAKNFRVQDHPFPLLYYIQRYDEIIDVIVP